RGRSRSALERRLLEQRSEARGLEEAARVAVAVEPELGEDLRGDRVTLVLAELVDEPRAQALVGVVRVEDPAHDELRRDRSVPVVRLEAERDVEAAFRSEAVELAAEPERDRS